MSLKKVFATNYWVSTRYLAFGKGATSYELQVGKYYVHICHLKGAYWKFKPWRRVSLQKENNP